MAGTKGYVLPGRKLKIERQVWMGCLEKGRRSSSLALKMPRRGRELVSLKHSCAAALSQSIKVTGRTLDAKSWCVKYSFFT